MTSLKKAPSNTQVQTPQQAKPVTFFQPKLTVNTPGDAHEQEADRVADQVMRMRQGDAPIVQRMPLTPVSGIMRKCAGCEEKEKEGVQRKETGDGDASGKAAPSVVSDVLSSGSGRPMESGTRQFMESRFGQDFSQVRVHTDSRAAESASAIQARAYTSGRDVVFGSGEYQPGSTEGQRLLAHELVHVGQQGGGSRTQIQRATAQDCSKEDMEIIEVADLSAYYIVKTTVKILREVYANFVSNTVHPKQRQIDTLFYKYFNKVIKPSEKFTLLAILGHFQSILNLLTPGNDDYQYECENDCDGENAYVYGFWTDIHLCMNNIRNYDTHIIGRTIIHEMSHYENNTDDEAYCKNRFGCPGSLDFSDALDNADSYACFAHELFMTI